MKLIKFFVVVVVAAAVVVVVVLRRAVQSVIKTALRLCCLSLEQCPTARTEYSIQQQSAFSMFLYVSGKELAPEYGVNTKECHV